MEEVIGTLVKNGKTITDDLAVWLEVTDGPRKSWRGSFIAPEGIVLGAGFSCRLELVDGRSGEIVIPRSVYSSDSRAAVSFVGNGPLSEQAVK